MGTVASSVCRCGDCNCRLGKSTRKSHKKRKFAKRIGGRKHRSAPRPEKLKLFSYYQAVLATKSKPNSCPNFYGNQSETHMGVLGILPFHRNNTSGMSSFACLENDTSCRVSTVFSTEQSERRKCSLHERFDETPPLTTRGLKSESSFELSVVPIKNASKREYHTATNKRYMQNRK